MVTVESWYGNDPRLDEALEVRKVVFVDEQAVPLEEELDGKDGVTWHLLARLEGRPVGTARLFPGAEAKIGRVAVLKGLRGQGIGVRMMAGCHQLARELGSSGAVLDAQVSAIPFYERLGYVAEGPVFLDANIEHRTMRLALVKASGPTRL